MVKKGAVFKYLIEKGKNKEKMLQLMLQSGLYYKKLFENSKPVAYKQEQLQIKSGL